jgi:hypothetical protein
MKWRSRIFVVLTLVLGVVFAFNLALIFAPDIFDCGEEWPRCSSSAFQKSLLIVIAAPVAWLAAFGLLWKNWGKF